MKRNRIIVGYGVSKEITEALSVSYPTVRRALEGDTSVRKATKIRQMAFLRGGYEIETKRNV